MPGIKIRTLPSCFANLELEYAKLKNQKLWQAKACNTLGVAYYIKSNYAKAIEWHQQSFAIWKEMDNKGRHGNIIQQSWKYIFGTK